MHAFILMRNLFTNLTVCEVFFILFFLLENVEDEGNKYSLANGREGRKGCMVALVLIRHRPYVVNTKLIRLSRRFRF